MSKILMVLSAADVWTRADGSKYESGVWAEELVAMHERFVRSGYQVELSSPGGVAPTIDKRSLDPATGGPDVGHFKEYLAALASDLTAPLALAGIEVGRYDAVVIPGGHGPVEDLHRDKDMGRVLVDAVRAKKVVGSVCHGPAALLSAADAPGGWPFAGMRMTAFSNEEEVDFGTAENAPWLLADRLRALGADYTSGPNWQVYVVRDAWLVTGQNPASSAAVADAVIQVLGEGR